MDRIEFLKQVAAENDTTGLRFKQPTWHKHLKRNKNAKALISDEWKRLTREKEKEKEKEMEGDAAEDPNYNKTRLSYFNVQAYPSTRPAKKYCDVTGLKAHYKAPNTGLRFHNSEIYSLIIKPMAPGAEQAYLKLRGDHFVLK
ncbi:chromatin-remodeling complex subunit IES6 [Kluyveromyces marxianus]|uniref:Chromatin-remodeling complex subunit IES6 n=1 Tax=Kluyveromyces marxianus TaxID=4911 RepID=A0ABX6EUG5_KLUMA|nr:chromatin-remodeling complex subunit IES6 [Kluyveromyces marxianus]BAP71062.1 chromatin-remodeling complex subunit IES6 [Kluyveromyces marxianus]